MMHQLDVVLKPLLHNGSLSLWSERELMAGTRISKEVLHAMDRSHLALLLVSADFLASETYHNHLPTLLSMAQERGLKICWLPLNHCLVEETKIAEFPSLWHPDKPLAGLDGAALDEALATIARDLKSVASQGGFDVESTQNFRAVGAGRSHFLPKSTVMLGAFIVLLAWLYGPWQGKPQEEPKQLEQDDLAGHVLPVSLELYVNEGQTQRRIYHDGAVKSGSQITLKAVLGAPAWLTVFCMDRKGVHPLFRNKLEPSNVVAGSYILDFKLDDTQGREIYFAIAGETVFSFEEDIAPTLEQSFTNGSKGPVGKVASLPLPDHLNQVFIGFNHL